MNVHRNNHHERVLVTGVNGRLGQRLLRHFARTHEVAGADMAPEPVLNDPNAHYFQLDITDRAEATSIVRDFRPYWILNAAAYTDVDGCETNKELCWDANVVGVETLCLAAERVNCKLLQVSTDYVFDGTAGPYREDDRPEPISYYGRAKLAGENAVRASGIPNCIVRTMVLFGRGTGLKMDFVQWVIQKLEADEQFTVVDDQVGNPTLADNLAAVLHEFIAKDTEGLYHVSGREMLTRLDFARQIAEYFSFDPGLIQPMKTADLGQKAPRPLKSGFVLDKAQGVLKGRLYDVKEALDAYKAEMDLEANTTGN